MGRRAGWLGLVGLSVAMASLSACRQIVGITDSPPEHLTATVCGLPYGTNVCASCVDTSCCAESTACAADRRALASRKPEGVTRTAFAPRERDGPKVERSGAATGRRVDVRVRVCRAHKQARRTREGSIAC